MTARRRACTLTLVWLGAAWTIGSGAAAAQDAGDNPAARVDLSTVVTLPVSIPDGVAGRAVDVGDVTYAVRAAPGFRVVGARAGRLDLEKGDRPIIPITLSVGPDLAAGQRTAAIVSFASGPGELATRAVSVRISEVRGLRLSLAPPATPVSPGRRTAVPYELTNAGNVADSVVLTVDTRLGTQIDDPVPVSLPPFGTVRGEIELDVAPDALPLPTLVILRAAGLTESAIATIEVPVSRQEGFLASFVRVPTRLFLGSSVRSESGSSVSPAYGIEAEGLLRTDLRLRVSAHDLGEDVSTFAFRGLQFGPRFRARVEAPRFTATAGDIVSDASAFAGHRLQGRGGGASVRIGRSRWAAHAGRPVGTGAMPIGGHQLRGEAEFETPWVAAGLIGVDERRENEALYPDQRLRATYLRLRPSRPGRHGFEIEAGWLGLQDLSDGRDAGGPAVDARYAYRDAASSIDLRARRQPMLAGLRAAGSNELRVSGVSDRPGRAGFVGQAYVVEGRGSNRIGVSRVSGIEAGSFLRSEAERFQLLGRLRASRGATAITERTVEGLAETLVGPGSIDARLEIGHASGGDRSLVLRAIAGFNLRSDRGWGRIGLSYVRDAWSAGSPSLDLNGAYRVSDRVEAHGSLATALDALDPDRTVLAQLGIEYSVRTDLSLLAGVEKIRSPLRGDAVVRFSLGVSKGLGVPVPFPRERAVEGVVFEDLNGDGVRQPDEPFLHGIRLAMGGTITVSRRGHFSFPAGAARHAVEVDVSSLDEGYLPPLPVAVRGGERLEIPVHRSAALRIEAFYDENGNGLRDPKEMPLSDVAMSVSRSSEPGWTLRTGDDGVVELGAVRPGSYVVSVDPGTLPRRAAPPGLSSARLTAGQALTILLAVPRREITILDARTPTDPADPVGEEAEGGRK